MKRAQRGIALSVISALLCASCSFAPYKTGLFSDDEQGIPYQLPKSVVSVKVKVIRDANKNVQDVQFELTPTIIPDEAAVYYLKPRGRAAFASDHHVTVSNGLLNSIDSTVDGKGGDFFGSVVNSLSNLYHANANFGLLAQSSETSPFVTDSPTITPGELQQIIGELQGDEQTFVHLPTSGKQKFDLPGTQGLLFLKSSVGTVDSPKYVHRQIDTKTPKLGFVTRSLKPTKAELSLFVDGPLLKNRRLGAMLEAITEGRNVSKGLSKTLGSKQKAVDGACLKWTVSKDQLYLLLNKKSNSLTQAHEALAETTSELAEERLRLNAREEEANTAETRSKEKLAELDREEQALTRQIGQRKSKITSLRSDISLLRKRAMAVQSDIDHLRTELDKLNQSRSPDKADRDELELNIHNTGDILQGVREKISSAESAIGELQKEQRHLESSKASLQNRRLTAEESERRAQESLRNQRSVVANKQSILRKQGEAQATAKEAYDNVLLEIADNDKKSRKKIENQIDVVSRLMMDETDPPKRNALLGRIADLQAKQKVLAGQEVACDSAKAELKAAREALVSHTTRQKNLNKMYCRHDRKGAKQHRITCDENLVDVPLNKPIKLRENQDMVLLVDERSALHVPLARASLGQTINRVQFSKGLVTDYHSTQPSSLLEAGMSVEQAFNELIDIPEAIIESASDIVSLKVGLLEQERALIEKQTAMQLEIDRLSGDIARQNRLQRELDALNKEHELHIRQAEIQAELDNLDAITTLESLSTQQDVAAQRRSLLEEQLRLEDEQDKQFGIQSETTALQRELERSEARANIEALQPEEVTSLERQIAILDAERRLLAAQEQVVNQSNTLVAAEAEELAALRTEETKLLAQKEVLEARKNVLELERQLEVLEQQINELENSPRER